MNSRGHEERAIYPKEMCLLSMQKEVLSAHRRLWLHGDMRQPAPSICVAYFHYGSELCPTLEFAFLLTSVYFTIISLG